MATRKRVAKKEGATGSFVLLSDLHAHPWAAFSTGSGQSNSRLQHGVRVLDASLAKAQELEVPWVFAGDLVHTAGYALNVVLAELMRTFLKYPDVIKLAVWGNHDARGIGGRITLDQTVWSAFSHLENLTILDPSIQGEEPEYAGGLTFHGAGYQPQSQFMRRGAVADIGVYHQTVRGSESPDGFRFEEGVDSDELLERHRMLVVGHVHHWQYVNAKQHGNRVLVPGSPEHQNFGDKGEHGWWVITLKNGAINDQLIPGGSPKFLTVPTLVGVKRDGNFYRVESVANGQVLPDDVTAIGPTPTSVVSRGTLRGLSGDAILEAWLKEKPFEIEGADRTQVIELGRALLGTTRGAGTVRPLRATKLLITDFCSHADTALDLTPGARLVLGKGKDYPSNGAGKSTLFEALFWCLFGVTTKGLSGNDVIRWGADTCEVTALFEDSETAHCVSVTRRRGKTPALDVIFDPDSPYQTRMEAASTADLTQQLLDFLGITPELFKALAYFSQEKLMLFASATDGERKEMLADLVGASLYQSASEAAGKAASAAEAERLSIAEVTQYAQSVFTERTDAADAQRKEADVWESARTQRVIDSRTKLVQFDEGFEVMHSRMVEKQVQQVQAEIAPKKKRAVDAHGVAHRWLVAHPQSTQPAPDVAIANQRYRDAASVLDRAKLAMSNAATLHREATARLRAAESMTTCPTCGQPLPEARRASVIEPLREATTRLLTDFEACRDAVVAAQPGLDEMVALVAEANAGVAAARQYHEQEAEMQRLWLEISQYDQQLKSAHEMATATAAEQLMTRREALESDIMAIIGEHNVHAEWAAKYQLEADAQKKKIEAMTATWQTRVREAAIFTYWRTGFSKQGIQSLLMDEVAGQFNQVRSRVLPALTQGVYDVQFSTVSQTGKGEWREKTEFKIYEHGEEIAYEALSGGQRRRVDIGVMLTLVLAISEWMETPGLLGVLVLDEVFGFLDDSGAEGLLEALREVQKRIPAIFVISHEAHLQSMFPETIVVEQDPDGTSRVVVA